MTERPQNPDGPNRDYTGNEMAAYRATYELNRILGTDIYWLPLARKMADLGVGSAAVIVDAIEDGLADNSRVPVAVRERAVGDVKTID